MIAQYGTEPAGGKLAHVPLILDLAKTPSDRQALLMLFGRTDIGRPYLCLRTCQRTGSKLCGARSMRP